MDNLRGYDDIIIKQADKGSAVVVMDRARYVGETMRQLNDKDTYIPLKKDPTEDMIEIIMEGFVDFMVMDILVIQLNSIY